MQHGAAADSASQPSARFEPPEVSAIGRLFPQLEIVSLLGKGGMGAVYKTRQPVLHRFVALKVLTVRADGSGFADRFTREAKALARLSHPAIVRVFELGEAGGLHYLIRESVGRANLRQLEQAGRPSPRDVTMVLPKSHKACDCLRSSQRRLKFVRTHAGRLIETDAPDERKASLLVRSSFETRYSAPCANAVRTSIITIVSSFSSSHCDVNRCLQIDVET